MRLEIYRLAQPKQVWPLFAPHHYLRADLSNGARCWLGVIEDQPIAFTSAVRMPSGTLKNAWREHRTVVLPDYQGLGFGLRLSEWVGEWHIRRGERYYSRTTHPRIGEARTASPLWRATDKNKRMRKPEWSNAGGGKTSSGWARTSVADTTRLAYSHEYIGHPDDE